MIRTNLSTRPFYNERAVHAGLVIAAVIVIALTAVNAVRIVTLSRQSTELTAQVNQAHAEAARLTQEAAEIRRGVDGEQLQRIVLAASEANALIDQRTFSWTEFFNRLEATMPPDVMLTAVRPSFEAGAIRISMNILGRRADDIDEFMERLEASGTFENVLPAREDPTEQGYYRVSLSALYLPAGDIPPEEAAPRGDDAGGGAQTPAGDRRGAEGPDAPGGRS